MSINPFIDTSEIELQEGEILTYLNTNISKGKIIQDKYMVSNKGRVFSYNNPYDKLVELTPNNNNTKKYYRVGVQTIDNEQCPISVHRAVLCSFDPIDNMHELTINHKNGEKADNYLENLEWLTNIENIHHACDTGLRKEDSITDDMIINTMNMVKDGHSDKEISDTLSIKYDTVKDIRIGHNYLSRRLKDLNFVPQLRLTRITDDIIRNVIDLANKGYSDKNIAEKLGLKRNTVINIRVGRVGRFDKRLKELNLKPVLNESHINRRYK